MDEIDDMSTGFAASFADAMDVLTSLVAEVTERSTRVDALEIAKSKEVREKKLMYESLLECTVVSSS